MKRRLDLFAGLFMGLILAAPVFLHAAGASAGPDSGALGSSPTELLASPVPLTGEANEGPLGEEVGSRDRARPDTEPVDNKP